MTREKKQQKHDDDDDRLLNSLSTNCFIKNEELDGK